MADWQPLEIAPKYERILLFGHQVFIGSVCHDGENCLRDRDNVQMGDRLVKATHWQPLPAPPCDRT